MAQTIQVNQSDAVAAAEDFSRNARNVSELRQMVASIVDADLAEWKGSAADAAKATMTFANDCMTELSDSIDAHGANIKRALLSMQRADSQIASSYAASAGAVPGSAGTSIPGAYGAGLAR